MSIEGVTMVPGGGGSQLKVEVCQLKADAVRRGRSICMVPGKVPGCGAAHAGMLSTDLEHKFRHDRPAPSGRSVHSSPAVRYPNAVRALH